METKFSETSDPLCETPLGNEITQRKGRRDIKSTHL